MSQQRNKQKPIQLVLLLLLILLMLVSFSVSFIPIGHAQEPEPEITTTSDGHLCAQGEVLVKFKQTVSASAAEDTLQAMSSESLDAPSDIVVADVPEGETVESFVDSLEALPNVEYAQPNYVYSLARTTVSDPYASLQWHLDTMGVPDAWDITMGDSSVVVAVIDTGADLNHPDLAGQIVAQTDVVDNDGSAQDDDGHGTHVAGIIGAVANNGIGVAGIAPGAKLIAVDVFGYYENPETGLTEFGALTSEVIEGIQYAVSNGADVINMSLGGPSYDSAFEDAVNDAITAGVVVVAAAGNEGVDTLHYPSDFDACISVIATDPTDLKASWSNYGSEKDISAPGVSILSTFPNDVDPAYPDDYLYMGGTSMASPTVAGVVALMLSVNPSLTVNEVKDMLYNTAVDLGIPGRDVYYGEGRINAYAAISAAAGISYTPVSVTGVTVNDTSLGLATGETYQLNATVSPSGASNKAMTYSSDNPAVATVSPSGLVTAVGAGNTDIVVTSDDGGFTGICHVNVITLTVPVAGIALDKSSSTMLPGDSVILHPTITPSNATNKTLTLVSDNPSVATVHEDSTGIVVTAAGEGTAKISAVTNDGGYTAMCVVTVKSRTIKSSVYQIDASSHYLRNVTPDTSAAQLKANLRNDPNDIDILDAKGALYTGSKVATGMAVQLDVFDNGIDDALTVVIRGDTGGDGGISISDYTYIRLHILSLSTLSGAAAQAADVDQNGGISIADYTLIRLHILGLKPIY